MIINFRVDIGEKVFYINQSSQVAEVCSECNKPKTRKTVYSIEQVVVYESAAILHTDKVPDISYSAENLTSKAAIYFYQEDLGVLVFRTLEEAEEGKAKLEFERDSNND